MNVENIKYYYCGIASQCLIIALLMVFNIITIVTIELLIGIALFTIITLLILGV
jgi:hypothetical protein